MAWVAVGAAAVSTIGGSLLGSGGSSQTQSTQQTLDPRMESAIYGDGGLLAGARDWYSQNRGGINPQMLEGLNNQYRQLGASTQGYNQMQQLGMGLMGSGISGNPFSGGYAGGTNFIGGLQGNGAGVLPTRQQYQPAQLSQQAGQQASPFVMPVAAPAPTPAPVTTAAQDDAGLYGRLMSQWDRSDWGGSG